MGIPIKIIVAFILTLDCLLASSADAVLQPFSGLLTWTDSGICEGDDDLERIWSKILRKTARVSYNPPEGGGPADRIRVGLCI